MFTFRSCRPTHNSLAYRPFHNIFNMVHRNKQLKTLVLYTCMSVMASAQLITNAPSSRAGPTTVLTFTPTGEPSDLPSCSPTSFPSDTPTSEISSEIRYFSSKSSKSKSLKSSKSSKSKSGKSSKSEKSSKGSSIRCSEGKGSKSSKSPGKGKGGKGSKSSKSPGKGKGGKGGKSSKSPGKGKGFAASIDITPDAATGSPTVSGSQSNDSKSPDKGKEFLASIDITPDAATGSPTVSGTQSNDSPLQTDTNSAYDETYLRVNGLNGDTNDPAGTPEMEKNVSSAPTKALGASFLAVLAVYFIV